MPNQELFYEGAAVSRSQRILYTPSNLAKSSLLHLQEVGQLQAVRPHSSDRAGLHSYLFFIILSGSGTLDYNGKVYPLSAGNCVFIDCSVPYTHSTSDNLWKLKWCHFYGPNMAEINKYYMERGGTPCLRPEAVSVFDSALDQLYQCADATDQIRDIRINEILSTLLSLVMQESCLADIHQTPAGRPDISQVKEYLNIHAADKITLDSLADHFFINKFYLMRLFKAQYGISINHYLQQIRITRAKHMLRFTNRKVEMIGLECGLGAHGYFTRIFKKVEGLTPSEYRAHWQQ